MGNITVSDEDHRAATKAYTNDGFHHGLAASHGNYSR